MKKLLIVIVGTLFLTGCYNTRNVTSHKDLYCEILKIQSALSEMGYDLSGEEKRSDNNMYVADVSYSTESGYGTAMSNKYVSTDKYTFTNKEGNTMSFCVSYELRRSYDSILYVTNVNVPQCETSNPKDYTKMCGYNSPIRNIENVPPSTPVKIYNEKGSSKIGGLTVMVLVITGLILLLYPTM